MDSRDMQTMLSPLVPELLSTSRVVELAQVGDALSSQLHEAASLAIARSEYTLRHNLGALLAVWPPTDRGLVSLLR